MQIKKHQSWRIYVRARVRRFDFKIQASKFLPNWRIGEFRFSVLLKIRRFFLKMAFQSGNSAEKCRREGFQSKTLRVFKKFGLWRIANKTTDGKKRSNLQRPKVDFLQSQRGGLLSEEPIVAITGNLALLSNSVSEMNYGGITIHAFTIFLYLVILFKNYLTRKIGFPSPLLASVASSVGFCLNYLNYRGSISKPIWKAWSHSISFGCLYILTQVIFSRFSLFIGRSRLLGFLISAAVPILTQMSDLGVPPATPSWTANLLLACQTFLHVLGNPKDPKTLAIFMSSAHCLMKEMAHFLAGPLFGKFRFL